MGPSACAAGGAPPYTRSIVPSYVPDARLLFAPQFASPRKSWRGTGASEGEGAVVRSKQAASVSAAMATHEPSSAHVRRA